LLKSLNQLPLLRVMLLQVMLLLQLKVELLRVMLKLLMGKLNREKQQNLLMLRKNLLLLQHLRIKRNNI
jgi:hypothetical protein